MTTGNPQQPLSSNASVARVQDNWYSAARQSKRDQTRLDWARFVLEEEDTHPLTHSAARVRRARLIIATLQSDDAR